MRTTRHVKILRLDLLQMHPNEMKLAVTPATPAVVSGMSFDDQSFWYTEDGKVKWFAVHDVPFNKLVEVMRLSAAEQHLTDVRMTFVNNELVYVEIIRNAPDEQTPTVAEESDDEMRRRAQHANFRHGLSQLGAALGAQNNERRAEAELAWRMAMVAMYGTDRHVLDSYQLSLAKQVAVKCGVMNIVHLQHEATAIALLYSTNFRGPNADWLAKLNQRIAYGEAMAAYQVFGIGDPLEIERLCQAAEL